MSKLKKMGWLPDLPDFRDLQFVAPPKLVRAAKLAPVSDTIRKNLVKPYDQGQIGSCVGNAAAAAVVCQQMKQARPQDTPSRLAIYYGARELLGTINQDSGCYIRDAFKVLAKVGAGSETLWLYKTTKFKTKPPSSYFVAAEKQQAVKYERVQQTADQMKASLAAGVPIEIGFTVYDSFGSGVALDGIAQLPEKGERTRGGHAVLIVGYTNDLKAVHSYGTKLKLPSFAKKISEWFIVRNSWGTAWGDNGYFYMPSTYLTNPDLSADLWRLLLVE